MLFCLYADAVAIERQTRLQEVLKGISSLFKRLHVCWDKVRILSTLFPN